MESAPTPPPQHLPVTAEWCLTEARCIALEVARTPEQQRLGLMQRPALPPLRGMWFPFNRARRARFWMHNTLAPLDMVFLRDGQVIHIESDVPVCPALPCPSYGPSQWADGVVELGAGEARRLGLTIGQNSVVRPLEAN